MSAEVTVSPALAYYPPGASYGPRTLTDFELVWVQTGSAQWHGGGGALQLGPGDLLLIPPGTHDEFRWDRQVPTRHGYVHFRSDPGLASVPLLHRSHTHGPVGGLLDFLLWLGETRRPGWRERTGELIALIARVLTTGPMPEPLVHELPVPESAPLAAALDYTRRQWAAGMRPIQLRELAAAACVSPSHLSRVFRRQFGRGPRAALELVRLDRARTMLARGDLSVGQVAHACGFADPLYFSRRFRAAHGIAPRAYRAGGTTVAPSDLPWLPGLARRLAPE
ncbi:MAG: AraC family transcriptional regulator [Trebonia sp.]